MATLDTTRLDQIINGMPKRAAEIVEIAAREVESLTKQNITAAPLVDTGNLHDSIQSEPKDGPLNWWVHDGTEYGYFWEVGFHQMVFGRFQMIAISRRPFMVPAVEARRSWYNKQWKELFK